MSDTADAGRARPSDTRSNRLGGEASVYLRQHAGNPIHWQPWDRDALARARDHDLPIFLSIGYSSCHWCHVMAHEVFEDAEVAALLNERFVCIKVDREERPDLDEAYMAAVTAQTGRGGWPLSVFLTSDLQPFHGATYVPRARFLELCHRVDEAYRSHRGELQVQAGQLAAAVAAAPVDGEGPPVAAETVEFIARQGLAHHDPEWGGFLQHQKFPTPLRWQFLLHHHRRTGDPQAAAALRRTLEAMATGGIRDHLGGGFHRYTVEETWLVPHFEIMLYDNAQLASLYLEAGAALEQPWYLGVARDVLDFLLAEMRDGEGGFCASFDADSGGQEGSYYVWTPQEILAAAGERDGPLLATLLGVAPGGNFDGRSILTRRVDAPHAAMRHGREPAEAAALFDRLRPRLREIRAARTAPALDRKIVTAWNGLALSALARASAQLDEPAYAAAALQVADRLWSSHRDARGHLVRATTDGRAAGEGVLDDYACLAEGLLDLYQATGDAAQLQRAGELLDLAVELFADDTLGFALTARGADAPLGRRAEYFDSVEPSGAAALLHGLWRAALLSGDEARRALVVEQLRGRGAMLERAGLEMAWWADTALLAASPAYAAVIAGEPGARDTRALRAAFWNLAPPWAVLATVPAAGTGETLRALVPVAAGLTARNDRAVAHVCLPGACGAPTSDPDEFVRQLLQGWQR
ncbi:MAG: thioredoxin domain-containing protein [Candidatus Latescibacteria bacterium]|nr:thioredoxin domain-containing protein [Candidatus Latescibacterota bacterium]